MTVRLISGMFRFSDTFEGPCTVEWLGRQWLVAKAHFQPKLNGTVCEYDSIEDECLCEEVRDGERS